MTAREQGRNAESLAADYLENRGWRVLVRNYQTRQGEVDLVAAKGIILAFVEVRFRSSVLFGSPEETVTRAKRKKVTLAAYEYAMRHRLLDKRVMRFDVIAIVAGSGRPEIIHIEDAFEAELVR